MAGSERVRAVGAFHPVLAVLRLEHRAADTPPPKILRSILFKRKNTKNPIFIFLHALKVLVEKKWI